MHDVAVEVLSDDPFVRASELGHARRVVFQRLQKPNDWSAALLHHAPVVLRAQGWRGLHAAIEGHVADGTPEPLEDDVRNAIVPPRFSTRSISLIAISGRGANMCANWLSTTSNSPSRKGRLSTSPCFHAISSTSAIAAFSFATARSSGVRSRPATTAPARRAVIATTPVPHPTSSTRCPGRTPAKCTSFAAVGVVIWASGANDFHASRCATL